MILVIDNYDSFTYNLVHALPGPVEVRRNDAATHADIVAMKPRGIVLSPGPGHPAHRRDVGVCQDLIEKPLDVPMLGVCLGMQSMAFYTGGTVAPAPEIVHGEARPVQLADHPLFAGVPRPTMVGRYHSLAVSEVGPDWVPLGSAGDTLMAMRHKTRPWVGVQFHPESILSPAGQRMMTNFASMCA